MSMTEWRRLAKEQGKSLVDVAIDYEMAASGWSREEVVSYMRDKVQKAMYRRSHASYEEKDLVWQHTPFDQRHEQNGEQQRQNIAVQRQGFKQSGIRCRYCVIAELQGSA